MKRFFLVLLTSVLTAACGNESKGTGSAGAGGDSGFGGAGGEAGRPSARYRPGAVEIRSPSHGSFVEQGATSLEVSGIVTAEALSGPNLSLAVNGQTVEVDPADGSWSTVVALGDAGPLQSILATLSLSADQNEYDRIIVLRGQSVAKGDRASNAAFIQVTDAGFDVIEPVALSLLPINFADAVPNGATVLRDACVVRGPLFDVCYVRASAVVDGETRVNGDITVGMDARTDLIALDMSVNDIAVPIRLSSLGFVDCSATASLGTMNIRGGFELAPLASDPALVDVEQSASLPLLVSQSNVDINVRSCDFDFLTPLIDLVAPAFESMVQGGMESYLNARLSGTNDTPIAAAIQQAMATIKVAQTVGLAMGASVDGVFTEVNETESDALLLADIGFVPACMPADRAPKLDRALAPDFVPSPMPVLTPISDTAHHVGLAMSPAGFNQILRSMTECGLLLADLTELPNDQGTPAPINTGLIGLLAPGLRDEYGAEAAMHVELTPTVGPFVTGEAGPNGELIAMTVPQLRVDFVVTEPAELALSLVVDIVGLGVNLVPAPAGTELAFAVNPPEPEQLGVYILDNPYHVQLDVIRSFLPSFLPGFLEGVIADIPAFPIPEFAGLTLRAIEVSQTNGALGIFTTAEP